jgi:hypothetical protein
VAYGLTILGIGSEEGQESGLGKDTKTVIDKILKVFKQFLP